MSFSSFIKSVDTLDLLFTGVLALIFLGLALSFFLSPKEVNYEDEWKNECGSGAFKNTGGVYVDFNGRAVFEANLYLMPAHCYTVEGALIAQGKLPLNGSCKKYIPFYSVDYDCGLFDSYCKEINADSIKNVFSYQDFNVLCSDKRNMFGCRADYTLVLDVNCPSA